MCHGDTQRELVNTPWTHHVLHLFFVEWDPLSKGDLVHFLLYYGIDTWIVCWAHLNRWLEHLYLLILAAHLKMVRILVLSFLFKGESFSFVRGLWLLDLDNRKTLLVDISWISFASGVLTGWLKSLLLPSIREIVMRSIFFGDHCLVYRRMTSAWAFL